MARALVIASSSFVGRHICAELESHGHEVKRTDLEAREGVEKCDLVLPLEVKDCVQGAQPDWIVNCAGATTSRDPAELYRVHLDGTRNLLLAVREHAPNAVVLLFGSAAEYGDARPQDLPLTETAPTVPSSFFGASKLAQTHFAQTAAREWEQSSIVVRPANIIGPGVPDYYLAGALVRRIRLRIAKGGSELSIENGHSTRDFVDVRDVAGATHLLLENYHPKPKTCEVFNIATGSETRVVDLATRCCSLVSDLQVSLSGSQSSRTGVVRNSLDPRKIMRAVGWKPTIDLDRSLLDTWHEALAGS